MPKIIIKEYDKTKAGSNAYGNFAVVVPGFIANGQWEDSKGVKHDHGKDENDKSVFDENGIYECSSQADFVQYIGKNAAESVNIPAEAPKLFENNIITLTTTQFNTWKSDMSAGNYKIYIATETEDTTYGHLKGYKFVSTNKYYKFVLTENYVETAGTLYAKIKISEEGRDAVNGSHYGNQIAYELLGLGYTVLYKKLTKIQSLYNDNFWSCLTDKSEYDFRYVLSGLISVGQENSETINAINNCMIKIAEFKNTSSTSDNGRGDCVALCDIDSKVYEGKSQSDAVAKIISVSSSVNHSKYAALFVPSVTYSFTSVQKKTYNNSTFPASFHYLACAAKARENNFAEWYAVAGYTRGVSDYVIESLGCGFGEKAINSLEPRFISGTLNKSINVIAKFKDLYYLWGNRTCEVLGVENSENGDLRASHFLNIRQLCCSLKKEIYTTCRQLTFDPNSDLLWINFCNAVRPTLDKMKADQGILDYKFVKVKTDKKATLMAKVRIVPIEAVEDFDISVMLEDSLSGVSVSEAE